METLGALLSRKARENKSKPYLYFLDSAISYEEMNEKADRMSGALRRLGIGKGDHVTLMMPNSPDYLYCWFGLAKLGAVLVAINTQLKGESLRSLIEASDSRCVVIGPECFRQYEEIREDLKGVEGVIFDPTGKGPHEGRRLDRFFKESSPLSPSEIPPLKDIEPLIITFTSGTTGLPKLVRNSHRAYITAAEELSACARLSSEDRIYSALPLYHANPQVYCVLTALVADAGVVVAPRFSASQFWEDIRRHRATAFSYVGAVLPILLAQPESPDDQTVPATKCFGGGAPKEVYEAVSARFGVEVLELYGMSETGTWNTLNRPGRGKPGTVGQIRKGFDVRIFDDEDNELPVGKIGEIVIRPLRPHIMFDGYYKSPEETVKCSSNWWFHTGDLGKVDEDGYYTFCGRKKESIRRGGENIAPYEIEKEVLKHPAVAECAAYGVSDPLLQEETMIAVVLRPGKRVNEEDLLAWCRERLARFMLPRYVEFMEKLPKSASEKVQKVALKERGTTSRTWDRLKA